MRTNLILVSAFLFFGCKSLNSSSQPDPVLTHGEGLSKKGLYQEAIHDYQKRLKLKPNNPYLLKKMGITYAKMGNYKEAYRYLIKSYPSYKNSFDANYFLAESLRMRKRFPEAIFFYRQARKIRPNRPRMARALAWCYFRIGQYDKALFISSRLSKKFPSDTQSKIVVIRTLVKLKRYDEAQRILTFKKTHKDELYKPFLASVQGDIYFGQNKIDLAMNEYRKALFERPFLAGSLLGYGRCMLMKGNIKSAVEHFERALRVKPNMVEGYFLLAKAYEINQPKKAVLYYKRFLKKSGSNPEYLSKIEGVKNRIASLDTNVF